MTADPEMAGILAAKLDAASQARLGRSLAVFPAFAAECGGCALEWAALRSAAHGLARHGITVVDHPAAADVLLVAGAVPHVLADPLRRARAAMGEPSWVLALGACAIDGGPFTPGPAIAGGADTAVPVDMLIPGCPPTPEAILSALLTVLAANDG